MSGGEMASAGSAHDADLRADPERERDVARLARRLCWVWIVPLGAYTAWCAFVLLLFAAFRAEVFEHDLTPRAAAIAVGIPIGAFVATTVLGVVCASFGGRSLARMMPRAGRWGVASVAALAGATLALGSYLLAASASG